MSRRKQNGEGIGDRKLMDRIALDEEQLGPMRGLLATTYELDPSCPRCSASARGTTARGRRDSACPPK